MNAAASAVGTGEAAAGVPVLAASTRLGLRDTISREPSFLALGLGRGARAAAEVGDHATQPLEAYRLVRSRVFGGGPDIVGLAVPDREGVSPPSRPQLRPH